MINVLQDGVESNPVMDNLKRMVTIPRKLNMDQFQYHLISDSQMTQETNLITDPMEQGGNERSCVVFYVHKSNNTNRKLYSSIRIMDREIFRFEDKYRFKLLLNQKNYILKNKKITDIEIDEIRKNIRHDTQDNAENNIREGENNSSVCTNEEHLENKDSGEDAEQNIARDKLREELQIMWYN
jgi:hypothetical protein